MDMTAMLAKAWRGMMRRRCQRLALEELVRMAPHRRDELGIDLVSLREAGGRRERVLKEDAVRSTAHRERRSRSCPRPSWV